MWKFQKCNGINNCMILSKYPMLNTSLDVTPHRPAIAVRRGDVLSAWSGIRPLVSDPNASETQSIARNHIIEVSNSKLITIAGRCVVCTVCVWVWVCVCVWMCVWVCSVECVQCVCVCVCVGVFVGVCLWVCVCMCVLYNYLCYKCKFMYIFIYNDNCIYSVCFKSIILFYNKKYFFKYTAIFEKHNK